MITGEPVKTTFHLHLGRGSNNFNGPEWELTVEDAVSGQLVLRAVLTNDQFSDLMSARGTTDYPTGQIWTAEAERWGRFKREHDTMAVYYKSGGDWTLMQMNAKGMAEAKGWNLTPEDHPNPHRHHREEYTVHIWRWVPVEA